MLGVVPDDLQFHESSSMWVLLATFQNKDNAAHRIGDH